MNKTLMQYFDRMAKRYGPTHWWPGDSPFEIAIGAILTQNTAWTNVEKAIVNLKREKLLSPRRMLTCPIEKLETALRPSGYFRQKAQRVRLFCQHLMDHYGGSVARMSKRPLSELREELLSLNGIGPETADDILLYACGKTVFVVDAYTRRIFSRHGLMPPDIGYEDLRAYFEQHLEPDLHLYKEYHGLIVWTGKDFCRKQPKCDECPLAPLLHHK
ncbi:MAG TPA: endonuclease III domain-containing protein [Candidatus Hydrogenedentes bacterium]|nr:endonuclease III domain-containing protein [Candidatus Hydrogenedentota bacterium]